MKEVIMKKYSQKLSTPEHVAQMVSSGDRIFFSEFALRPESLDEALANRAQELQDVMIEGVCITKIPRFIEADPKREHFIYNDWHFSGVSRKLYQEGLCSYIPFTYHQGKSTWERSEALIGIAHPKFRDELIRQAQEMKIWLERNRHDA
jgi:acyl-CoA hydrolase